MRTAIETPVFLRYVSKVWSELEREEFVSWLAEHSESGDLIAATGGLRKVRRARSGISAAEHG